MFNLADIFVAKGAGLVQNLVVFRHPENRFDVVPRFGEEFSRYAHSSEEYYK